LKWIRKKWSWFDLRRGTEENLKYHRIAALGNEISNWEIQNMKYECHPPSKAFSIKLK